jgi:hypothetical protein
MMGYIKTEDAIEALYRYGFVTKETIEKNIRELPSIDLVRCKECKHKDEIVNYCYENDRDVNADDFCSYGERESDE